MRGNATRRPDARLSVADARAQLQMLLINCSDERLAGFTAASLTKMYRVRHDVIDQMLMAERGRRAGR